MRAEKPSRTLIISRIGLLLLGAAGLLLLGRWLDSRAPEPWGADDKATQPWNILLVSLDTTRPDYLEACGGSEVPTPALLRIRGNGFVFSEMTTPAPITLPAHASLFTGLDPYRHGVRENTEYALPDESITLAARLRKSGYRTAAFVASFVMDSRFGLDLGFETYDDRLSGPGLEGIGVEVPGAIIAARTSEWINDHAARRRDGRDGRPFFLFVHFFDAHAPYRPPAPFAQSYSDRLYSGELAYQDHCLGLVLDTLEATGEADRTLVWVISDHGESLGEHGEQTHSLFVYDATLRTVSILRPPPDDGHFRAGRPRLEIPTPCSLIDVYPTLLDLTGTGVDDHETGDLDVDGRSLLEEMKDQPQPDRMVYAETLSPWVSYHWSPLHAIRSSEWKYIRAPYPELYDLREDPQEVKNVASSRPDLVDSFEETLTQLLAVPETPDASREPSEEEQSRLRSLGYLSAGGSTETETESGSSLPDPKRMIEFFTNRFQSAKSQLHAGNLDRAIEGFQQALQIDPLNNSIHLYLAAAYRQSGRLDLASRSYREAIRIAPESPRSWYGWGRCALMADRPDSAAWAFRRSLELLPGSPDGWSGLGEALWAIEDPAGAAAAFDSSLSRGGEPRWTHGILAWLYGDALGDPGRARPYLEVYSRMSGLTIDQARERLPRLDR